jgi:alanine racemase
MQHLKTWVEINGAAVMHNVGVFRGRLNKKTAIWAVVKSNAYGHGFSTFTKLAAEAGVDGFCVDSVPEALKIRLDGITQPILVLGPTLPNLFREAAQKNITLSFSTMHSFEELVKEIPVPVERPAIHVKVDTGMHRRGVYLDDLAGVAQFCKKNEINLTGVFSHFAAAKDTAYVTYSNQQLENFEKAIECLKEQGFTNLIRHIAATGGTMISERFHFDAVRIGIGFYGIYPSKELEMQCAETFKLQPVLSWHALVSEVKPVPKGEFIGYDLTEKVTRDTMIAIVPIGYWHGLPWALSGIGYVLIGGKRAKILGRVSMDMVTVDVTDIPCAVGDVATLIGRQADGDLWPV